MQVGFIRQTLNTYYVSDTQNANMNLKKNILSFQRIKTVTV